MKRSGAIRYRSSIERVNHDHIVDALRQSFADDRGKDRERGFTQRGPHADELVLSISGRSARTYGSKGQQRSLVLALKTAEIQLLNEKLGCAPIVLLDDVQVNSITREMRNFLSSWVGLKVRFSLRQPIRTFYS